MLAVAAVHYAEVNGSGVLVTPIGTVMEDTWGLRERGLPRREARS